MPNRSWSDQHERQYEHISASGATRSPSKLAARSYREIYAEAKSRGIAGRSTMSKEELERRLAS